MGVKIHSVNEETEQLNYSLVPEEVPIETKDIMLALKSELRDSNGWNKDRSMRLIGKIPQAVLYNYALSHGVPNWQIMEYYTADNGAKLKQLLNEFTIFKMVSAI